MKQQKNTITKTAPSLKFTSDQYLDFLKSILLKGLGMEQASFSIQRSLIGEALRQGKQLQGGFVANFYIHANESNQFVVAATTEVKQKLPDSEDDIVSINCVFTAFFECKSDADISLREYFAQNQAKLVIWPYVRQFVTESTNHMSISQILLPLTIFSDHPPQSAAVSPTRKSQRKGR